MKLFWAIALPILAASSAALAQTPASTSIHVAGSITSIDPATKQIVLKGDKGETFAVSASDKTVVIRIPAGETDVKKGTKLPLADLAVGDRIVAVGKQAADQKILNATSLLVSTKADLAEIEKMNQEDWQKRGSTGTVTAIDSAGNSFTIKVGQKELKVVPSEKTDYHHYSLDSAKFADAKPSTLAEIKVGDQARVLGNKNADGTEVKAEKIVSGTFRQIAATIKAINPATGELTVTDLATKKPLTVRINSDSTMKKLPDTMAAMLARRYQPGGGAAGQGGGRRGGGAGGGAGAENVGQTLDHLPAMPLSDLKPGDAIMVSTTLGSDPNRVTAITLLAGVEPLLTASPAATRDIMSGWNLGGGADAGGGN